MSEQDDSVRRVFVSHPDIDHATIYEVRMRDGRNRYVHYFPASHHGTSDIDHSRKAFIEFQKQFTTRKLRRMRSWAIFATSLELLFESAPKRIERPPGARLDAVASFIFKKRVYETVLNPYLSEMQEEYFEALRDGLVSKARWVRFRGVAGFWSTVALQLPVSAVRMAKRLWSISGG